ncbi:uncharacterized protein LOC124159766 [Ischnura elegans]|uniref:uncharacterized protein LOC124159766 n=1 Tax=Ischnura elegans TaxID=197161 RepID=UPI001ED8ADAF|nr:uncharacterized protein LOC124159766 [Ischnura elegans]
MSLCLRWLHNFRDKSHKRSGFVSPEERAQALTAVIRSTQSTAFRDELAALTSGKSLKRSSPLLPLRPFCDADGLLRVGGRLRNAVLDYDEKHPIIIPKDHHFTVLLVRHAHAVTLHGGLQATAAYLAQRYWIIRSRVVVKREIRTCVTCTRFRGETLVQRMGDLPEERVKPQRPFLSTGLDYAGPFLLRATKGRGHKAYKGYICLFICMVTMAVHLECVSDLTTNTFLLAFRRFVSRRGACYFLYSDNASIFRGAAQELKTMFQQNSSFYKEVGCQLSNTGTQWTFIPPYAPHFGGLGGSDKID